MNLPKELLAGPERHVTHLPSGLVDGNQSVFYLGSLILSSVSCFHISHLPSMDSYHHSVIQHPSSTPLSHYSYALSNDTYGWKTLLTE